MLPPRVRSTWSAVVILCSALVLLQCLSTVEAGSASIRFSDATTGSDLIGILVTVVSSTDSSTVYKQTTTSATITVTAPDGTYALTAEKNGYSNFTRTITIPNDGVPFSISLSPTITVVTGNSLIRSILTWGTTPRDLDARSYTPCGCTVYYGHKICACSASTTNLDVDDVSSYGPETISWTNPSHEAVGSVFQYWVNVYTRSATFSESEAQVNVYSTAGLVATYDVPASLLSSRSWHVFDLVIGTNNTVGIRTGGAAPTTAVPLLLIAATVLFQLLLHRFSRH